MDIIDATLHESNWQMELVVTLRKAFNFKSIPSDEIMNNNKCYISEVFMRVNVWTGLFPEAFLWLPLKVDVFQLGDFAGRWCAALSLTLLQPGLHWCLLPAEWVMIKIRSCIGQVGRVRQQYRENIKSRKRRSSFSKTEQQWRLTNGGFNLHTPTTISVCKKINEVGDANSILKTDSEQENKCGCTGFYRVSIKNKIWIEASCKEI